MYKLTNNYLEYIAVLCIFFLKLREDSLAFDTHIAGKIIIGIPIALLDAPI